jgi:acyl-CoA thioester hydrolase
LDKQVTPYYRKPFYYESDQMGIIHHSNYIRWFEEARIDFLSKVGFPYDKMEEKGLLIPVLSASCTYKGAIRFGESVIIVPKIVEFNGFRMRITYRILSEDTHELRATGETTHCFSDPNLRPVRTQKTHPDVYQMFYSYINVDLI